MKALLVIACGAIAFLAFTGRLGFAAKTSAPDPRAPVEGVSRILEQATRAGEPPPAGSAEAKLNNLCALRERKLAALRRPLSQRQVAAHARRVLAILRAHSRRAEEPPEVEALDYEHQRIVAELERAAARGDLRGAQRRALALRELAGRANATFLRLGLTQCLLRAPGMPL